MVRPMRPCSMAAVAAVSAVMVKVEGRNPVLAMKQPLERVSVQTALRAIAGDSLFSKPLRAESDVISVDERGYQFDP